MCCWEGAILLAPPRGPRLHSACDISRLPVLLGERSLPTVVLRDRASKAIFSHLLPTKGPVGSTYPEKAVLRDLNWLGYKRLVLTDQENAIKALGAAMKAGFPEDLTLEESPKGDSHGQSNGTAEKAAQRVQGQVRTMKYALEQSAGGELPKDSVIFPWMIEYAGVLHTLFSQEDSEGMTPFQKLKRPDLADSSTKFRRNRGLSPPGEEQA